MMVSKLACLCHKERRCKGSSTSSYRLANRSVHLISRAALMLREERERKLESEAMRG